MNKKRIIFSFCFIVLSFTMFCQSNNFIAQGNYYKSKELFEAGQFENALKYIQQSKQLLGGTNQSIQYLHIMILYNLQMWPDANTELKTFFDLDEGRLQPKYFTKLVENLTADETKELTKIMVDIQEKAQYSESPKGKIEKLNQQIKEDLSKILKSYNYSKNDNDYKESFQFDLNFKLFEDKIVIYLSKVHDEWVINTYYNERHDDIEKYYTKIDVLFSDIYKIEINNSEDYIGLDDLPHKKDDNDDNNVSNIKIFFSTKYDLVNEINYYSNQAHNKYNTSYNNGIIVFPSKSTLNFERLKSNISELSELMGK